MSELKRPIRYKRPCFYAPDDIICHAEHKSREEAIDECFAYFRQELEKARGQAFMYTDNPEINPVIDIHILDKLKEQLEGGE